MKVVPGAFMSLTTGGGNTLFMFFFSIIGPVIFFFPLIFFFKFPIPVCLCTVYKTSLLALIYPSKGKKRKMSNLTSWVLLILR